MTPAITAAAVLTIALVWLAFARPLWMIFVALGTASVTPTALFADTPLAGPEWQKALILVCLARLAASRGLRLREILPVAAYFASYLLTALVAGVPDVVTPGQTASSLATLSIPWFALAIAWRQSDAQPILRALSAAPLIAVVVSVPLEVAGVHAMFNTASGGVPRLAGTLIAAHLALLGVCATAATLVLNRIDPSQKTSYLLAINVAIVVATVTRGAIVALTVLAVPALWTLTRSLWRKADAWATIRLASVALSAIAVAAVALPAFQARENQLSYSESRGYYKDPSSGRFEAWSEFAAIAKERPLLGHGVGAGPVLEVGRDDFQAQHNEYLRLVLESGVLGGLLILAAILAAVVGRIRRTHRRLRPVAVALACAAAVYAITDNTLTTVQFSLPFALVIALTASHGHPDVDGGSSR